MASRPPDRTMKYKHNGKIPTDLSQTFYTATQTYHTKCHVSGKYIIVGLASVEDVKSHTSEESTNKLRNLGFELQEPPAMLCARTLLARKIEDSILDRPAEAITKEIETRNNVVIEDLKIIKKAHMLKLKLKNSMQAETLHEKGIRLYYQIIPSYNTNIQEYVDVTQCYKCYGFNHRTNECRSETEKCSKCAGEGHTFKTCTSETLKCLNCSGNHVAVAFKCPARKQTPKTPTNTSTTTTSSYASVTGNTTTKTSPTNTPHPTNNQPIEMVHISDPHQAQFTTGACLQVAMAISGGDLNAMIPAFNDLMTANNMPTIKFPDNFVQKYTASYRNTVRKLQETAAATLNAEEEVDSESDTDSESDSINITDDRSNYEGNPTEETPVLNKPAPAENTPKTLKTNTQNPPQPTQPTTKTYGKHPQHSTPSTSVKSSTSISPSLPATTSARPKELLPKLKKNPDREAKSHAVKHKQTC